MRWFHTLLSRTFSHAHSHFVFHALCSTGQEKRETARCLYTPILTKLAWSIKDSFGQKDAFSWGNKAINPARATDDGPILPTRVANQNTGSLSSPAHGFSHKIIDSINEVIFESHCTSSITILDTGCTLVINVGG